MSMKMQRRYPVAIALMATARRWVGGDALAKTPAKRFIGKQDEAPLVTRVFSPWNGKSHDGLFGGGEHFSRHHSKKFLDVLGHSGPDPPSSASHHSKPARCRSDRRASHILKHSLSTRNLRGIPMFHTIRYRVLGLASLMLLAALPALAAPPAAAVTGPRYDDVIDIGARVKPYLTPEGHVDPAFAATLMAPSPIYTDFFGIQPLADTTREEILHDFVPAYAALAGEDAHSVTLRFKGGYTARFMPRSAFHIKDSVLPFDHAYISGATWQEQQDNVRAFRTLLEQRSLTQRYLVANPSYDVEKKVAGLLAQGITPVPVSTDPTLTVFEKRPDAVLLLPEHVHGDDADYKLLAAAMENHPIDWLAMEALPPTMQPTLDAFSSAPEDSAAYTEARAKLVEYFTKFWNGRDGHPKTTGEENYYFKLADLARRHHARVIGMDGVLSGAPLAYTIFRYGEMEFGVATRNAVWAEAAPTHGRGVVFGGSGHMASHYRGKVQDFMALRNPHRVFVTLTPLQSPAKP
ncbi:MAG: hypothetical protein ACREPQ_16705 [Rhodanobacter sp.]